jgi:hypothetical protein
MMLSRPRLIAASLCILLVLAAGLLLSLGRFGPLMHSRAAENLRLFDVQEEPPVQHEPMPADATAFAPPAPEEPSPPSAIAVTAPRIAYTYGYSFRLDGDRIAAVQESHIAACRRLGPALCRVTAMQRGETSEGAGGANLKLQVAASLADGFGRDLIAIAGNGGGETVDRSIAAEDLSRQMIDSEARIRTREVLIQRLTILLQTRSGNIAQAVEAERAINTAQEELEAARAALADMRGRVAMSAVEIAYAARGAAPDSPNPIVQAVDQVASTAASSLGAMILILGVVLPWALVGGLLFLAYRTVRRRAERAAEAGEALEPAEPVLSAAPPAP